jgi:DNA polymerase-3 subunit delta
MMSEYQVVIVKEAQNLKEFSKGGGDDDSDTKGKASKNNSFADYIANPQSSTILVICYKYKKPDKRSAWVKALQKNAVYFESNKLYDNKIPDWVNEYIKEKKHKINPRAAQLIADYLGNDLSKIANELDKLFINIPEGIEITTDHIQQNIGISKDYNVFELQDAITQKDILKANRIINYFAANPKDNPLVLTISNLYTYFNRILLYHFIADKNKFNVAKVMAVNPYFVDGIERSARAYSTAKLKKIFSHLREADNRSKGIESGEINDGDLLKELLFKILH